MEKLNKILKSGYLALNIKVLDRFVIVMNSFSKKENKRVMNLPSHSIKLNRIVWSNYDWSKGGENWTGDVKRFKDIDPLVWKNTLINEIIKKYIKNDSIILEIGPGGGRWSEVLQPLAKKLILADITPKCLLICQEKFKKFNNLDFKLIKENLSIIDTNSIDYIWSYDVFVHLNPTDVERYIQDFCRILRPGAYGLIHHPGTYEISENTRNESFRSMMDQDSFNDLVTKYSFDIVEQNKELVHRPGDVITIFRKSQ